MPDLDDRDMLTDLLMTEKYLATLYNQTEAECTNQRLREELHTLHSSHEAQHAEIFKELHKRGWYDAPKADAAQIQQVIRAWEARSHRDPALNPGPARAGR
jgi:spore coat protein CotF